MKNKKHLHIEQDFNNTPKKEFVLIFSFLTFLLIALSLSTYSFLSKIEKHSPNKKITEEKIKEEEADINSADIYDITEILHDVVIPFYEARISGEEDIAMSFTKEEQMLQVFSRYEEEEWFFTSNDFESFEIIYSGDIYIEYLNRIFLVKINKKNKQTQYELISMPTNTNKIYRIDFNEKGYDVITYEDKDYLVLSSKKDENKTAKLTSKLFNTHCSLYGGDHNYCTIFIKEFGKLRKIDDISFISQNDLFEWHKKDKDKIVYQESFSEGGGAYDTIKSVDIFTQDIETIVRQEWNDFLGADARDVIYDAIPYADTRNCWVKTCTRKQDNHLCFTYCDESSNSYFYLIFNNKVILEDYYIGETPSFFTLDVKENVYNEDSFVFSDIDGGGYIFEIKTQQLRQL